MKKLPLIIILAVLVILLGAGGAWAYFHYSSSPESQILKSFTQLAEAKSVSYNTALQASGNIVDSRTVLLGDLTKGESNTTEIQTKPYEINMIFSGESDLSDIKSPASSLDFSIALKKNNTQQPELKFQFVNKDKTYYVRIPNLPNTPATSAYGEFANKWIEFDYSKLSDQLGLLSEKLLEKASSSLPNEKDTQKIVESLKLTMAVHPPLKVVQQFPDEKINEVIVHHYAYTLDQKNIELIMNELVKNETLTGIHQKDTDNVKRMFENISDFTGEIWFGKKDFAPYKMTFAVGIKNNDMVQNGKISTTVNLKNLNAPLNIQKPSETISFEEIMNKFFQIQMEKQLSTMDLGNDPLELTSSSTAFDFERESATEFGIQPLSISTSTNAKLDSFKIDTDNDGLTDREETLIWKTDPNKTDTDGDGYLDGAETKSGYDPLQKGKKLVTL